MVKGNVFLSPPPAIHPWVSEELSRRIKRSYNVFIGLEDGDRLMNLIPGRLSKDWMDFNRILG